MDTTISNFKLFTPPSVQILLEIQMLVPDQWFPIRRLSDKFHLKSSAIDLELKWHQHEVLTREQKQQTKYGSLKATGQLHHNRSLYIWDFSILLHLQIGLRQNPMQIY